MESLEVSAKTVSEAIQQALAILGKTRDEVDISVLSEGSRGILGIGGEEARILVSVKGSYAKGKDLEEELNQELEEQAEEEGLETAEEAQTSDTIAVTKAILERILVPMPLKTRVNVYTADTPATDGSHITLDIEGDDLGMLIGRRGETLSALQFMVNLIAGKQLHHWTRVNVDVSGYRVRREQLLKGLALRMAERVQMTHQPMALEAMPAHERRIVHMALTGHPHATTQSIGEGDERKVVISPKK